MPHLFSCIPALTTFPASFPESLTPITYPTYSSPTFHTYLPVSLDLPITYKYQSVYFTSLTFTLPSTVTLVLQHISLFIPSSSPSYDYKLSSSQTISPSFFFTFFTVTFFCPWLLLPFLPCVHVYFHFPYILVSTCVSHFLDILALCFYYFFNL